MAGEYVPTVRGCRGQIRTETKTIDTKKESATCTKAGGRFLFLNSFRSVNDPRATVPEMIQLPESVFLSSAVHCLLPISLHSCKCAAASNAIPDPCRKPTQVFFHPGAASQLRSFHILDPGGVIMEPKPVPVHCTYSDDGKDIAEIIRESFSLFLQKELLTLAIPKNK